MNNQNTLFLIGGTGGLGGHIAKGLVQAEGFKTFKALVRDPAKSRALKDLGWELVQVADFMDVDVLAAAFENVKVVVSAAGGANMVEMEMAAMEAAKKAGAYVYVPSQFGVDSTRWGSEFPFLAGKQKCVEFAEKIDLPLFSDFIFDFWLRTTEFRCLEMGTVGCRIRCDRTLALFWQKLCRTLCTVMVVF